MEIHTGRTLDERSKICGIDQGGSEEDRQGGWAVCVLACWREGGEGGEGTLRSVYVTNHADERRVSYYNVDS